MAARITEEGKVVDKIMKKSGEDRTIRQILGKCLPYILFLIAMCAVLSLKINLHVDEVYTYGLSNHMGGVQAVIEDGISYEPEDNPIHNYVTTHIGQRLEFGNVWQNQKNDVHPPLYYDMVHLICSFFPNTFSMWFAGLVNIVFALCSLFVFRKLCTQMGAEGVLKAVLTGMFIFSTGMFIFSAGILMNVSYFRMYVMAMFWLLAQTSLVLSLMQERKEYWKYPLLIGCAAAGVLTHYYCSIYTIALSAGYGVYTLVRKKWKDFGLYSASMIAAAGTALAAFPPMIDHVFRGYRGKEALNNAVSLGGYRTHILEFLKLINAEIFGGLLWVLLLALVVLLVWKRHSVQTIFRTQNAERSASNASQEAQGSSLLVQWLVLAFASGVYFALVTKVAPYQTDRYIFPIYPFIMLLLFIPLFEILVNAWRQKGLAAAAVLAVVITVSSIAQSDWTYLYRSTEPILNTAKENAELDAIYIYEEPWQVASEYMEMMNFRTVTFVQAQNLDLLRELPVSKNSKIFINVPLLMKPDTFIQEITDRYDLGEQIEKVGRHEYGVSFLVSK